MRVTTEMYESCASRAIVCWGFPSNVIDRELHNMLAFVPGYYDCWMREYQGNPVGVIRFMSPSAAEEAVKKIHFHDFDHGCKLRCELAAVDPRPGQLPRTQDGGLMTHNGGGQQFVRRSGKTNKVFIGRLSAEVLEEDVESELRHQVGFKKLRLAKRDGKAMVFAEFDTPEDAKAVVDNYREGIDLSTSKSRGIVTFARDMPVTGHKRLRLE